MTDYFLEEPMSNDLQEVLAVMEGALQMEGESVSILDEEKLKKNIVRLVDYSTTGSGARQGAARYLVYASALALGIIPASIYDLYMARGRGEVPLTFTVPAINLRVLPFTGAKAVFRAAKKINAQALILEIARSEIGYTAQRPSEYVTAILAAAIAEGYRGPVFLQGDHFQVSASRYRSDPDSELQALRELTKEAISAGIFNIDVDTSTLVDITLPTIPEQQALNSSLSADFTAYIRSIEPEGVTVSVGGEIGEVGKHNSTEPELRAYMDQFNAELETMSPGAAGLSKISIQTGTSHGGVVLPDGSIASVQISFETLLNLSREAREKYGLAGTVQHGASTLPEEVFDKFVEAEACEVHLATNFMNMFYDVLPEELREDIYAYLRENHAHERKAEWTDEQFYYKTRKRALGPFKKEIYALPNSFKEKIGSIWEAKFSNLFHLLGLENTRDYVEKFVSPVPVPPRLSDYLGGEADAEDVSDLAD
jgi:fructose/tagatose bisphosphate aldolase